MLPVAEEYKKIPLVEPAVADSITGDKWNKYIFRTGRNSSPGRGLQRRRAGPAQQRDRRAGQRQRLRPRRGEGLKDFTKKAKIVHEEYLPVGTTDFTAGLQRIVDKLKDQPGNKVISVAWAGAPHALRQDRRHGPEKRYGIELATGGNILPAMVAYKKFPGMEGALYYYFGIPKNPVNDAMVAQHYKRVQDAAGLLHRRRLRPRWPWSPPLKKTNGDTDTNKLIATMEA